MSWLELSVIGQNNAKNEKIGTATEKDAEDTDIEASKTDESTTPSNAKTI